MAGLYGKNFSREELLKRVGDISQVGGVRQYELSEGNEKGVKAVDFRTGTGFDFTVLPGRGMDISMAEYQGVPLCWRSSTGDVAASYYEPEGLGWLRSFYGGLLVTCGLTYAGAPCRDEGEELGLHGRVSHTPARNVCLDGRWENDEYVMWARGKVIETSVFGENICLTREIKAKLGETRLFVHDLIENRGFQKTPHMVLYHINGGFPVVSEDSELLSASLKVIPRDEEARVGEEEYHKFLPPTPGFKERCYYHEMGTDSAGNVRAALVNKKFLGGQGLGFYVKYRKSELPEFIEWKMNGEGTYVVGMEPANCWVEGRDKVRQKGNLSFLKPGERREYHLEIGILSSEEEISAFEEQVKKCGHG